MGVAICENDVMQTAKMHCVFYGRPPITRASAEYAWVSKRDCLNGRHTYDVMMTLAKKSQKKIAFDKDKESIHRVAFAPVQNTPTCFSNGTAFLR